VHSYEVSDKCMHGTTNEMSDSIAKLHEENQCGDAAISVRTQCVFPGSLRSDQRSLSYGSSERVIAIPVWESF